jgi:uncharacterized membrane protein
MSGRVGLNQLVNLTASGAMSGAVWGALFGLIFLNPLLGAALGAASGAIRGRLTDFGISDEFMKSAAGALEPGTAGLFLLIRTMTTSKVRAARPVWAASFDDPKEDALRAALAGQAGPLSQSGGTS